MKERTFLDTNIVSDRTLREEEIVQKIESAIGQTLKYCSAFVMSEHKRTFLLAMRFLWIIFDKKKDLEEVKKFMKGHNWRSDQEKDRYEKILTWISENGTLSYPDIVVFLESLIFRYDEFFFKDITVLESDVSCPLANVKMTTISEIRRVVPTCSLKCSISEFLKSQKMNLITLKEEIENHQHLKLVSAMLQRVISNPDQFDEDVCKTLADTIIVLEAPDSYLICSNNAKDFQPICDALRKRFLPIRY